MYLIRDVFRCHPGQAAELARRFKLTLPSLESDDGFRHCRVLLDVVADYWTVVLQAEVETLADFERHLRGFSARPSVRAALGDYMALVQSGHREIYRVV